MAAEEERMLDENPYHPPITTDPPPTSKRYWWEADIPPHILVSLLLIGIVQYWGLGLLAVYGFVSDVPHPILFVTCAFATYFVHWSSVGGLIGFAVSRKGGRGSLIGAITGAFLSALLMC